MDLSCKSTKPRLTNKLPKPRQKNDAQWLLLSIKRTSQTSKKCAPKVVEMEAKVKEAECQIPMAIAEALRTGNLGIMDYYKLQNIEADTAMRKNDSPTPTRANQLRPEWS